MAPQLRAGELFCPVLGRASPPSSPPARRRRSARRATRTRRRGAPPVSSFEEWRARRNDQTLSKEVPE